MCSIGEDDFWDFGGVHAMVPNQNDVDSATSENVIGKCKKCGLDNKIYKAPYRSWECRDCFLANARHKFRATLGSSKILPKGAKVLLVFDGSAEAIVLLDMLYHAQTQNNFKRLHCNVCLLHIDESILIKSESKFAAETIMQLQNFLKNYPVFESYIATIGTTNEPKIFNMENIESYFSRNNIEETSFLDKFGTINSLTSRQEFLKYHNHHLIVKAAMQLNCSFAFLPDVSTSLATQLLSAISLGRGSSVAYDVALVDERFNENVKLLRPLRDLNQPEIDLYLRVQGLKPLKLKTDIFGVNKGDTASLQNLTRAFVNNLQENYSATVSTVFRTCDKIAPINPLLGSLEALSLSDANKKLKRKTCIFCYSPLESFDTNTLLAIELSKYVSEKGITTNHFESLDDVVHNNLKHINDVNPICHACRNIDKDSNLKLFNGSNSINFC